MPRRNFNSKSDITIEEINKHRRRNFGQNNIDNKIVDLKPSKKQERTTTRSSPEKWQTEKESRENYEFINIKTDDLIALLTNSEKSKLYAMKIRTKLPKELQNKIKNTNK